VDVLESSREKDKIRRLRAEIVEQHDSIMELLSECALRFNCIPADIATALTDSASLPLEEQPAARRAVRDKMLRLLAAKEEVQQDGPDVPRQPRDDAKRGVDTVDGASKKTAALNVYLGVLVALNGISAIWIWPSHLSNVLSLANPGMLDVFPVGTTLAMNLIMIASASALMRGKKWGVDPFVTAPLLWGAFQAILSTSSLPPSLRVLIFLLGLALFIAPVAGMLLLLCNRADILPEQPDGTEC
jgi:hypothetical protein